MNILFECNDNSYVVELLEKRLYAKVFEDETMQVEYNPTIPALLNPASFHEYRGKNEMLYNKLNNIVSDDLKEVLK